LKRGLSVSNIRPKPTFEPNNKQEGQHPLTGQRAANFTRASVFFNIQPQLIPMDRNFHFYNAASILAVAFPVIAGSAFTQFDPI